MAGVAVSQARRGEELARGAQRIENGYCVLRLACCDDFAIKFESVCVLRVLRIVSYLFRIAFTPWSNVVELRGGTAQRN